MAVRLFLSSHFAGTLLVILGTDHARGIHHTWLIFDSVFFNSLKPSRIYQAAFLGPLAAPINCHQLFFFLTLLHECFILRMGLGSGCHSHLIFHVHGIIKGQTFVFTIVVKRA